METLVMHPHNKEQLLALKALAKARKISVETHKKSPYDPSFVPMVKEAEKRGNYKTIDPNDIWGSLNLNRGVSRITHKAAFKMLAIRQVSKNRKNTY